MISSTLHVLRCGRMITKVFPGDWYLQMDEETDPEKGSKSCNDVGKNLENRDVYGTKVN